MKPTYLITAGPPIGIVRLKGEIEADEVSLGDTVARAHDCCHMWTNIRVFLEVGLTMSDVAQALMDFRRG